MNKAQPDGGAEGGVDRLVRERFFPDAQQGLMVEVGAARPDYLSISALYRSLGWTVLAIDANPAYAELYRSKGLELLQYACAEADAEDVDFTVVDSHGEAYQGGAVSFESFSSLGVRGDFATLREGTNTSTRTIKVPVRRLDTILRDHAPSAERIDILSVDVEGWELEVLGGLTFSRYQPKVVILENLFLTESYRRFMRERGYVLWRFVAPNEVWVRPDLLRPGEALASAIGSGLATAKGKLARLASRAASAS